MIVYFINNIFDCLAYTCDMIFPVVLRVFDYQIFVRNSIRNQMYFKSNPNWWKLDLIVSRNESNRFQSKLLFVRLLENVRDDLLLARWVSHKLSAQTWNNEWARNDRYHHTRHISNVIKILPPHVADYLSDFQIEHLRNCKLCVLDQLKILCVIFVSRKYEFKMFLAATFQHSLHFFFNTDLGQSENKLFAQYRVDN